MKKVNQLTLALVLIPLISFAQDIDFTISLKAKTIDGLDGTHSYVFGQHEGKWLILGGRKDGLHARQPFNAFPSTYNNDELMVIDPSANEVWTASLSGFSINLSEQLQSSNMCFGQVEDTLYMLGGYSYAASQNEHITFPYLTTVVVSEAIAAIVNGNSPAQAFSQVQDNRMAVAGGHIAILDSKLLIVGGHRFDGRYNPMGHNTYTQTYTNAIRSFKVNNKGNTPLILDYEETIDQVHLHRRDYNLVPQVFGDGSFGYMISSGVFQQNVDLPYLYPVEINSNGHTARTSFNQYLSNYHSATVTIYDSTTALCHSIFFGGMAQYYYVDGVLTQDNNVPFVKTISMVTRNTMNDLDERELDISMPELQGSSSEFIPNHDLEYLHDEIAVIGYGPKDSILLGHIYGGIKSSSNNPFTSNNTGATSAAPNLFEVWLSKGSTYGTRSVINDHAFTAELYPNPGQGEVKVKMDVPYGGSAYLFITDVQGKLVKNLTISDLQPGQNNFTLFDAGYLPKGSYHFTFSFDDTYFHDSALIIQ